MFRSPSLKPFSISVSVYSVAPEKRFCSAVESANTNAEPYSLRSSRRARDVSVFNFADHTAKINGNVKSNVHRVQPTPFYAVRSV